MKKKNTTQHDYSLFRYVYIYYICHRVQFACVCAAAHSADASVAADIYATVTRGVRARSSDCVFRELYGGWGMIDPCHRRRCIIPPSRSHSITQVNSLTIIIITMREPALLIIIHIYILY